MSYLNILLQVEVIVHNCILHDRCMPAATIFSVEDFECAQGLLLCVCLFVLCEYQMVHMGGESWHATKIFKPHSQISRLGMWTICFPI